MLEQSPFRFVDTRRVKLPTLVCLTSFASSFALKFRFSPEPAPSDPLGPRGPVGPRGPLGEPQGCLHLIDDFAWCCCYRLGSCRNGDSSDHCNRGDEHGYAQSTQHGAGSSGDRSGPGRDAGHLPRVSPGQDALVRVGGRGRRLRRSRPPSYHRYIHPPTTLHHWLEGSSDEYAGCRMEGTAAENQI